MSEHTHSRKFVIEPLRGWETALNLSLPCEMTIDADGIVRNEYGTPLCRASWLGEPDPRWQVQPLVKLEADVPARPE